MPHLASTAKKKQEAKAPSSRNNHLTTPGKDLNSLTVAQTAGNAYSFSDAAYIQGKTLVILPINREESVSATKLAHSQSPNEKIRKSQGMETVYA